MADLKDVLAVRKTFNLIKMNAALWNRDYLKGISLGLTHEDALLRANWLGAQSFAQIRRIRSNAK